jgi:flagellar L-ring protein precursor FlgH
MHFRRFKVVPALITFALLGGCGAMDRINDIGKAPDLDPSMREPQQHVALPMPEAPGPTAVNSLWQPGSKSFFHDPRASRIGDILTVDIAISDAAKLNNTTSRSRTNSDDANLTNFMGLEGQLTKILPKGADPASLVKMGSDMSNVGAGSVNRSEAINLTLAAVVTQVTPNGNLVIAGHQQVRVNNELRDLQVTGLVRPEDITSTNTIDLSQIAEARISYGGKGTVSDVQQPRYGSQLYDIIFPF